MVIKVHVDQFLDEIGLPEEFTWDLFPIVRAESTLHLEGKGLPKIGTKITPGMIIIGKRGNAKNYRPEKAPTAFDAHIFSFEELKLKFGEMYYEKSLYATEEMEGTVVNAYIEEHNGKLRAVVEIAK